MGDSLVELDEPVSLWYLNEEEPKFVGVFTLNQAEPDFSQLRLVAYLPVGNPLVDWFECENDARWRRGIPGKFEVAYGAQDTRDNCSFLNITYRLDGWGVNEPTAPLPDDGAEPLLLALQLVDDLVHKSVYFTSW